MDVFDLRTRLVDEYAHYVKSFIRIRNGRISDTVGGALASGSLWPDPLVELNPSFERARTVEQLVDGGVLHPECADVFSVKKEGEVPKTLHLFRHQEEAILRARDGRNYVLTTGTGSGKSLAYIIPIVDFVLRNPERKSIKAIVVYPLNALANSQYGELEKFLCRGYPDGRGPVTFERYTGQETEEEKERIRLDPPDILLTNYVMLELILTRTTETPIVRAANDLRFLVMDELHTYRGRQGADVAMLIRRSREYFRADDLQLVGTSATMASGEGDAEGSAVKVAEVASRLFGAPVERSDVIGETLSRYTREISMEDASYIDSLRERILAGGDFPEDAESFAGDPLAIWLESTFGTVREPSGMLVRAEPGRIEGDDGAATVLSDATGIDREQCSTAIRTGLLSAYRRMDADASAKPPFAFRLHQFISPSETVFSTIEPEEERQISLSGKYYDPATGDKVMYPLVFCRECGQEYYSVRARYDDDGRLERLEPRQPGDRIKEPGDENLPGYLYLSGRHPWPDDDGEVLQRVPQDWLDDRDGRTRIRKSRRDWLPEKLSINASGEPGAEGTGAAFIASPFRFCPTCGVSYDASQRSDYAKLASLGTEGRSTAITILSLFTIMKLMASEELAMEARKLLSFSDNRQDASLQAGHFNDFIEIGFLRGALYRALSTSDGHTLRFDELPQAVVRAMDLPVPEYAENPDARYLAAEEATSALQDVVGYRLYLDQKRGWRINFPNLEQCGLLKMDYAYLDRVCGDEEYWEGMHPALASASSEHRAGICRTLLDFMRRELCISSSFLERNRLDRIKRSSQQHLNAQWAIDDNEKPTWASVLFPRSGSKGRGEKSYTFVTARGGFGKYLRRSEVLPDYAERLTLEETDGMISDLLGMLRRGGLLEETYPERRPGDVPGYRIKASAMIWARGDGESAFWDPIRVPNVPDEGRRPNAFFKAYYMNVAQGTRGLVAREHTAQVAQRDREERERSFREGDLPILYCSPTMELGVDIAQLNVVNMRNVPPNPANYAQRSGRAGRQGQPALVFSYCGKGSPHDQYFFRRPERMVSGRVQPPEIDLANEELLRAHLHSVWLKETGAFLGQTLTDVLDVQGDEPTLDLRPELQADLAAPTARRRAVERAGRIMRDILPNLDDAHWYGEGWIEREMDQALNRFEMATSRWKDLYLSARSQVDIQNRIIKDASRSSRDRERAARLHTQARRQLELLVSPDRLSQGDFYSYRYFASEGFLPGYSFPRLPLSAYIPGRRSGDNEYIQRPRFIAVSEFAPRSIIYHEGSKYVIDRVIFSMDGDELTTDTVKRCGACGYMHDCRGNNGPDLCEYCGCELDSPLRNLFKMCNVSTKRRERINADEEERQRRGYELMTAVRFETREGRSSYRKATIRDDSSPLAELTYAKAAKLWRMNLGWRRRKRDWEKGFLLDVEEGRWASKQSGEVDEDDPDRGKFHRVIPYVEDHRNSLIFEPVRQLAPKQMLSLEAALRSAIQVVFHLEERELQSECLPSPREPRTILIFEAAEGGAGVLGQLFNRPDTVRQVAREALSLCHFDPHTGKDLQAAPGEEERCTRACYDCLLSYGNQRYHEMMDRHSIRDFLMEMANATTDVSPVAEERSKHLEKLLNRCDSDLERDWLRFLDERGLSLPDRSQHLFEDCGTRADFLYSEHHTAIFIDGPHHDDERRAEEDRSKRSRLEDLGYLVLTFGYADRDEWPGIIAGYPSVFGSNA